MEEVINNKSKTAVMSLFEYHQLKSKKKKDQGPVFISNSLLVRKHWLEDFGGSGLIPSPELKSRGSVEVFLLGHPSLPEKLWQQILEHNT